jgi:hypothetical protein
MSTPVEPPTEQSPLPPPAPPPGRRPWRSRLRSRGVIIGAAVVALLVVGGVTAALLIPDRGRHFGPGFGRMEPTGELDARGEPWGGPSGGPWGGPEGGPWRGEDGFGDHDRGGVRGIGNAAVLTGTVSAVSSGTLVVNVDGGAQRTLRADGDTRVQGVANSGLGDLQAGERVVVQVQGTGDAATARTVWTPQARVTGTVTALAGDRATVTSIDGLTVTVDVATLSQKPVIGDVVVLTGVAADGSTIRADGIRVLPRAS